MNGKSKCRILKEIRKKIAQENDIEYMTSECKFQGDCTGTCPKCEAELRYLEQELQKRQKTGKAIAVAGIAAAMVVTASGCALPSDDEDAPRRHPTTSDTTPYTDDGMTAGALVPEETESWLLGDVPYEESTAAPTQKPTEKPVEDPTQKPTEAPTQKPTQKPVEDPTQKPTEEPTEESTQEPTKETGKELDGEMGLVPTGDIEWDN